MTLIGMALTGDGGVMSVGEGRSIRSSSPVPSVFHPRRVPVKASPLVNYVGRLLDILKLPTTPPQPSP